MSTEITYNVTVVAGKNHINPNLLIPIYCKYAGKALTGTLREALYIKTI
jgi:hypothetical protein